jgi:hypothetical protein
MAIRLTCPCGKKIPIRDEDATKWVSCPRCGVVVNLPPEEGIGSSPGRPAGRQDRPRHEVEEEDALADLLVRHRRQEGKGRRRYLRGVNRGLALHYVAPFLFLAGTGAGMLALVLVLSGRTFEWEKAVDAAGFFFVVSGVILFLSGALAIPAAFLALLGAPPTGSLLSSVGLFAAGCLCAALLVVFPGYGPAFFGVALVTLFGAWVFWMIFLCGLGSLLERQEVAEGAGQILWSGVLTLALGLPTLLVAGMLVAAMVKRPFLVLVIPTGVVGAAATIIFVAGGFESLLGMVLTPTGIPFVLEYLNFIGGLRMVILRRS